MPLEPGTLILQQQQPAPREHFLDRAKELEDDPASPTMTASKVFLITYPLSNVWYLVRAPSVFNG